MAIAQLEYPRFRAFDSAGKPLSGGKVYVYEAGTTTKTMIYADSDGNTTLSNPVTLNSDGEAEIWFDGNVKVVLEDKDGNQRWTFDDLQSDIPPVDVGRFNLLENGSFEIDSNGNGLPDGWTIVEFDDTSTVELDQTNVNHGANSLKFVSQGMGGGTATTPYFFNVTASTPVVVAFSIVSSVADVLNSVQIRWHDKDETFISSTTVYNEAVNNPTSYEEKRFAALAPSTATMAKLRLVGCDSSNSNPGTTYFDDIKFYSDSQAGVFVSTASTVEFQDDWTFSGTGGEVTASAEQINKTSEGTFLTGDIKPTTRTSEDSGWLFCNGQAVSRSTYADLFNEIGDTFGAGDGTTTFNVPDLRDRSILGTGTMGASDAGRVSTYNTGFADSGGEDQHTLTESEIPGHSHSGTTGSTGGQRIETGDGALAALADSGGGITGTNRYPGGSTSTDTSENIDSSDALEMPSHTHSFSTDSGTGGGGSHNTVHPFLALNYMIKT